MGLFIVFAYFVDIGGVNIVVADVVSLVDLT